MKKLIIIFTLAGVFTFTSCGTLRQDLKTQKDSNIELQKENSKMQQVISRQTELLDAQDFEIEELKTKLKKCQDENKTK